MRGNFEFGPVHRGSYRWKMWSFAFTATMALVSAVCMSLPIGGLRASRRVVIEHCVSPAFRFGNPLLSFAKAC